MEQTELTLAGRLVADATHDLNNVLAVVRDAGGLLRDILAVNRKKLPHADKLERICDSIDRQTRRGATVAKGLNRFAHGLDEPVAEVEAGEAAELALGLTARRGAQNRTELEFGGALPSLPLIVPPFRLHLALCSCLKACIESAPGGKVELTVRRGDRGAVFIFAVTGWQSGIDPGIPAEALAALGAEVSVEGGEVALAVSGVG